MWKRFRCFVQHAVDLHKHAMHGSMFMPQRRSTQFHQVGCTFNTSSRESFLLLQSVKAEYAAAVVMYGSGRLRRTGIFACAHSCL